MPLISDKVLTPNTARELIYTGCRPGAALEHWRLSGAGHVWPGAPRRYAESLLGPATSVIDVNEIMWEFFAKHAHGHAEHRYLWRHAPNGDRKPAVGL